MPNTGGHSPCQGGAGDRGRQPCVDQGLRVSHDAAAASKSRGNGGKSKSKQKPFTTSHLSYVANLKSGNSVPCLQFKRQARLVMFANQVK